MCGSTALGAAPVRAAASFAKGRRSKAGPKG